MDMENVKVFGWFGFMAAAGAVTTIVVEKAATKYGHSFMQIGPKSLLLLGTIGAVQNLASIIFSIILEENMSKDQPFLTKATFLGHLLTACSIVALTALAEKVNLISARLTLFAGAALIAFSLIENFAVIKAARYFGKT